MSYALRMIYRMTWALLAGGLLTAASPAQPTRDESAPAEVEGFELLFRPVVREELEIVDEQEQQLRELGDTLRNDWQTMWREVQELPPEQRWQAMRQRIVQQRQRIDQRVREILLDHQLARLKQVKLQVQIQQRGMAEVLNSPEVRETLGLSDDQIVELRQVASQVDEEMRQKIRAAVQQAREQIVSVLSPQQRSKWQNLVGAPFDPNAVERGESIRVFGPATSGDSDPTLRRTRDR